MSKPFNKKNAANFGEARNQQKVLILATVLYALYRTERLRGEVEVLTTKRYTNLRLPLPFYLYRKRLNTYIGKLITALSLKFSLHFRLSAYVLV